VIHALLFQKIGEVTERELMPFNRFEAVVLASMIENILFNGRTKRPFHYSGRALAVVRRRQQRGYRLTLLVAGRIKKHRNTPNSGKAFTAKEQVLTLCVPAFQPLTKQALTETHFRKFASEVITTRFL
jgi:hypothetical protein